jgi:lipopolysaccharide assembly outer membrane protein LptD (OstA)
MRLAKPFAAGIVALIIACVALAGPPAAQAPAPDKKPKDVVNIDGDKWKWHGDKTSSVYDIIGNVVVKHGDTTVTADKAQYDEKARVISAEGSVKIVDGQNTITGDKATTFLKERRNLVDGHVKMVGIPKPATKHAGSTGSSIGVKMGEPTTIVCDRLEYLYRAKIATAEGNLTITQKNRRLVSTKAVYDINQEVVTLTGGVRVTDDKQQTFSSPGEVKVSMKEGSEWIEAGNGSATLHVNLDEETGSDGGKTSEKSNQ